jgi:UDP-N-acetylmuramoyl-L-alanyl-D-glutamate--2,6-diaminopimelate ligase
MAAAAARFADELIITDDNPRSEKPEAIVAEIRAGLSANSTAQVIHDRAAAITAAVRAAGKDDAVVVAGKGHEDYQIYGSETRSFSDRSFVATLVGTEART